MITNIQDKLRASNVMRWHTVPMVKMQSVAEHSFNVAIMCLELSTRLGLGYRGTHHLVIEALHHDLHEIIDGDTPSPVKPKPLIDWSETWDGGHVLAFCDLLDSLAFASKYHSEQHGQNASEILDAKLREIQGKAKCNAVDGFVTDVLHGRYKYEW